MTTTPGKKAAASKTTTTKLAAKRSSRSKAAAEPPMLRSMNPRTGELLREIPTASVAEVHEAVEHARKVAPEWAAIAPEGRARLLRQIRYRVYEMQDEIVETVSAECGKPRNEALINDVYPTIQMLFYLERNLAKFLKPEHPGRGWDLFTGMKTRVDWRPFGVVGCITPWNYPITNCFLAVAPPLFAGNTVVIKPSEVTPACGELVRRILEPLPSGVATVVQGGGDIGAALVDAPCDKISFIGSPTTGRRICEAAAKHLTPVVMELGGIDSAIVCDDADIEMASSGLLWSSFFNAGQTCCSIERAFVVESVAQEFEEKLLAKLATVKQSTDPEPEVGSLTFPRQLDTVKAHVSDALEKGATLLAGGPEAGVQNVNGTLWFSPTVLGDVTPDMDVSGHETFGPVLAITRVRDTDEAIRRANEEGVNLTASIWTSNPQAGESIASKLKAGGIAINDASTLPGLPYAPWGGVGEAGFGRLNGKYGIREFVAPVTVAHNATPKLPRLWWYPYTESQAEVFRGTSALLGAPTWAGKIAGLKQVAGNITKVLKSRT
jgi:acyl-CoA reductase-like NAD-dependent aldehyde dehydrogenase